MLMVAASAVLAVAQVPSGAATNPAIDAFQDACVRGSFSLSPARGRLIKQREYDYFFDTLSSGQPARRTIVKLNTTPPSYLIFSEYQRLQARSIARTCALDTKSVSKREAIAAYLDGLPEKVVMPDWIPNMYQNKWTSDHPELGYVKLLRFRDDKSLVLEIGMYPAAAEQLKSGTAKQ